MSADMSDEDDVECPLCLDTLSFDDLSFFPCSCGYQICRFCWHHIKANLNGRCPACRKPYDDAAVEFKPMKPEELKRLQAAKKQREKEKKDAETNARRHAANVRVRQRAQVHIQGMTTKIANEDTLAYLKSPDQFGRFGKILKLFFSRRAAVPGPAVPGAPIPSSSIGPYVPVNVYINYSSPAEANACIAAIDGTVTPDGHKLKATWGTTRYCPAYLRGVRCTNENCMQAHEPGEELESSTHPAAVMLTRAVLRETGILKAFVRQEMRWSI
ncbi:hypothetical protein P389DRAFT_185634 [Cystobasidium minutum MCA 4210]|uniref:uncharacterized protein n=1 Tax=Cystobasidium minutum MCA 4210 TaxID=1397322 RepID=UPI0034CE47D9|eukprot:jgi/Rhomi1/185634/estExt_fgenesh1_pm.C_30267